MKPGYTGIKRIRKASQFSMKGLQAAWDESAFRQEVALGVALVPLSFWLGQTLVETAILITSYAIVLIAELLNTAVEAVVDRVGTRAPRPCRARQGHRFRRRGIEPVAARRRLGTGSRTPFPVNGSLFQGGKHGNRRHRCRRHLYRCLHPGPRPGLLGRAQGAFHAARFFPWLHVGARAGPGEG